jgi:hypothetical protein
MKANDLKECGRYILLRKRQRIPVRYLGFVIDQHLFENLGDRVDEIGHFSLTHDEVNDRIEEQP